MSRVEAYHKIRPSLSTGDYLLCSGTSPFSRLIRHFTASRVSHVGKIIVDKVYDRVMVAEAVESVGVRLYPLSRYVEEYNGSLEVRHDPRWEAHVDYRAFGRFILDQQGREYDSSEIARIAMRLSLGVSRDHEANDAWICSEFVFASDLAAGKGRPWPKEGFVAPSHYENVGRRLALLD